MTTIYHKSWTTHIPMLIKTVNATSGPVLEIGSGLFSTPLLHWICKYRNQEIITLEHNPEYYDFARGFQSKLHRIRLIDNLDNLPIDRHWGVILIDHEVPGQTRGETAIKLKDHADYIVLHDTEDEEYFGYDKIWGHFKYRYDWKDCPGWTTVISNFKDLSWLG